MYFIKERVGDIKFEQIAANRYRVIVGSTIVNETSNAAEAKIWFCGEVERKLDKHISALLEKQGINPLTGAIGRIKET